MEEDKSMLYIVATGDIIHSSMLSLRARERLLQVMRQGSQRVQELFPGSVPLDVDIFRGDSWQMLVTSIDLLLHVPLFYRCFIKAGMEEERVDTRVSIALGRVEMVPDLRVSQGDGEAYRLSGQALDTMSRKHHMVFSFPKRMESDLTLSARALIFLADSLVSRWTARQACAVAWAIAGKGQEEIAGKLWPGGPISQQAVAQHLSRAGWHGLSRALEFLYERFQLLEKRGAVFRK